MKQWIDMGEQQAKQKIAEEEAAKKRSKDNSLFLLEQMR